ncbi:hypothetical protein BurJ1DRAFT_2345 [Burkholderiales bacterium JOSHI_001]|nr:hypothetical protein BurJ1DRAFT_2345 [Burkholderiales bacterium JOSHI_001]
MTLVIRELERVEHRVLGALRCIDAGTRATVDTPLQVTVPQAGVRRNRSGLYVITSAEALAGHEAAFEHPPATPAPGSVSLLATLRDPGGRYLPRTATLQLPRDPLAIHSANADSLFRPIEVPMYPSSAAPTGANWALLRVTVTLAAGGDALGGVLLRVLQGTTVLARGMTDARGEALVAVPGVPVTTWSDAPGAVVVNEIGVQLEATAEAAALQRVPIADVAAGRAPAAPLAADPERLEAAGAGFLRETLALQVAAGRSQTVSFLLALPP